MSWNSGGCVGAAHGGAAYVNDFDGRIVRIEDADVRDEEAERLAEEEMSAEGSETS